MVGQQQSVIWRFVGGTVRGASHRRGSLPNQDAIAWAPASGVGSPLLLSVADGHGARASFRSATGSALAVDVAIALLTEFLNEQQNSEVDQLLAAAARIPEELAARWRTAVDRHAEENPLPNRDGNFRIAYGTTMLAAAVTERFLLLVQLGDGDILIVAENGEVRRPWPRDDRYLGGETPSLCSDDAASHVRLDVQPLRPESHQLILLCTDGYANSFRQDDGFLSAGRDILEIIQQEGIGRVERELEDWLRETSDLGSGDDITAGILWRTSPEGSANGG
jgi:serine/threonine protein phosphatase PrpC